MKKQKINNKENKDNKNYKNNIPDDIKILFGKFDIFSIIYILFFSTLFPLVIIKHISIVASVMFIILLLGLYIYMIYDVIKNKGKFLSTSFFFFIVLVITSIIYSIYKLF